MIINGFYERFKPPLIAHVSTFPPTHCGIATYCSNLIKNLHHKKCKFNPLLIQVKFNKYPISDHLDRIPLFQNVKHSYFQVLDLINKLPVECVSLQHEFKLFGDKDGKNILLLLKNLNKPLITTLHSISPNFTGKRRKIVKQIVKRSNAIIVLSNSAARILMKYYNVSISKINVIPHGVPNLPFVYPSKSKMRSKMKHEIVFISAGFLREKKGIEYAFQALAMLKPSYSNFMYFILGENHPRQENALNYRFYLQRLAKKLNLEENVTFIDQYLSIEEMINYIWASDICLIPYKSKEQSSSGILALFMACGRPVVSTNFQYAKDVIQKNSGIITPTEDSKAFLKGIQTILYNKELRMTMMKEAYGKTKNWKWNCVAERYLKIIESLD